MTDQYTPNYDTDHIRTKLKPREYHPAEVFAADILRQIPREYLEYLAGHLAESLKKEDAEDHPMGAVWQTLVKVLNGEEVHGRFLMGLALYVSYTLFNVGATCKQVLINMNDEPVTEDMEADEESDNDEDTSA